MSNLEPEIRELNIELEEMVIPHEPLIRSRADLQRMIFLISAGLFLTTIGQPGVIGNLPFKNLLKTQFHMDSKQAAGFFAVATMAWYFKPLAGLLCDSFPLFGTRRRWYLIISSTVAGILWMCFAICPRNYMAYCCLLLVLNLAMVISSTVIGGLLVETGQNAGATGRLASLRHALEGVMAIVVGPTSGFLASKAFGLTAGVGACLLFSLVPAGYFLLHEPQVARINTEIWSSASRQFRVILRSGTMWSAAILLLFVFIAPGLGGVLFYYQTDHLHFSTQFIGNLGALGGIGGLLGTGLYAVYCRKFNLKTLLTVGILVNAITGLFYLGYHSRHSAEIIEFFGAFLGILGVLPLFDLASRATPKGSESFGYALLMSLRNIAVFVISVPLGAKLYEMKHTFWYHHIEPLAWLNSGTSLIALALVPLLPKLIVSKREGEPI